MSNLQAVLALVAAALVGTVAVSIGAERQEPDPTAALRFAAPSGTVGEDWRLSYAGELWTGRVLVVDEAGAGLVVTTDLGPTEAKLALTVCGTAVRWLGSDGGMIHVYGPGASLLAEATPDGLCRLLT